MKSIKEKIIKLSNKKYFIPIFVTLLNLIFFVICNILFEFRYGTVDDFTIMKIISKLDGSYSIYGVYIHPFLCTIIIFLFKTGININWYTIFLLTVEFISFTVIGTIFINKNKKIGTIFYVVILGVIYSRVLVILNYTSISAICVLAGIIHIMYTSEMKKNKLLGFILLSIGIMLRWKCIILILPFYIGFLIINVSKNKNYAELKNLGYIIIIFLTIYITNSIIYNLNPIYKNYTKFNKIRTYFFDSNILDYEENKDSFDKSKWSYDDWKLFYTYSFADENFYNTENLIKLKENLNIDYNFYIDKIMHTFDILLKSILYKYMLLFSFIIMLVIFTLLLKCNRKIVFLYFIIFILLSYILYYLKPVYRVIISLYSTTIIMLLYILIDTKDIKIRRISINKIIYFIIFLLLIINNIYFYKQYGFLGKNEQYRDMVKSITEYTNNNKENIYLHPNIFLNISLAFSVYEKIPDNTFSNLRYIGDWDMYDGQYYKIKERYNIDNIITDLYKKENIYLIDGNVKGADNNLYEKHIDTIISYIKQHYNINVNYDVIKEFRGYNIKIYRIFEERKNNL